MPKLHLTSQIWYCAWDLCCSEHGLKRKTHRLCANVAVFNHIGIPNNFSNFSLKRCQGFLGLQGGEKQNKTKQRRQQLAKAENWTHPHLSRSSIRDTGNHCSAGNVFHARFAQGTNTFAKIDMSPYNQYVACQLACILKQFYGVNSNSLTSSYYVKIFFFFFISCERSCTGRSPEAWLLIYIYTEYTTNHRHQHSSLHVYTSSITVPSKMF